MDVDRIRHLLHGTNGIGRRRAATGLFAGAAATLSGISVGEAKKKNKKKCKKPNKCPRRGCCSCTDGPPKCGYVEVDETGEAFCESFCPGGNAASGAVPGKVNICTDDFDCVRVNCPLA